MQVVLEPTQDVLSLYTPFAGPNKERIEHTRSVLLQRQGETPVFTIISSVTFCLVVSLPRTVPIDYLLRYMIMSYCNRTFSFSSKDSDKTNHAPLYTTTTVDSSVLLYLRRLDKQNTTEYEDVARRGLFKSEGWRWHPAGSKEIEDFAYRQMRNINFIRDVKQVGIFAKNDERRYKQDAQYRITFDNHAILHHFLNQFKRGTVKLEHKDTKFDCAISLLDPVATTHGGSVYVPYEGSNYVYYIEKQLNGRENTEFHASLHFKEPILYPGGILHPSSLYPNDALHTEKENTVANMMAHRVCEDNTGQRLTKTQFAASQGFHLLYNRFFVNLSLNEHTHLEYFTREKVLLRKKESPSSPAQGRKKLDYRKPTETPRKNQPSLQCALEKIPEESKRKREEEVPAVTKKQRTMLDTFFTKSKAAADNLINQ